MYVCMCIYSYENYLCVYLPILVNLVGISSISCENIHPWPCGLPGVTLHIQRARGQECVGKTERFIPFKFLVDRSSPSAIGCGGDLVT